MDLLQREKDNYDSIGMSESDIKKVLLNSSCSFKFQLLHMQMFLRTSITLEITPVIQAIGAINMDSLRKDLQFLVNEGHIYNTTDDEHYALID